MLSLENLGKIDAQGHHALLGLTLSIGDGEIVAVIGGDAFGKAALLRLLAGMDRPTRGTATLAGRRIDGLTPEIGAVFPEAALMPALDVVSNVELGLPGLPRAKRRALALEALARVGLETVPHALPSQLPPAIARRVAMARVMVAAPRVVLLDAPSAGHRGRSRVDLQNDLLRLWAWREPTMVVATDDVDEAAALADRVVVLLGGGGVSRVVGVDLPRPRDRADPAFIAVAEEILDELRYALAVRAPANDALDSARHAG
ncbi:MAG: ABC transporter ATP-binding protein [Rhodospirillales bacterium]|nr:ABC transporter ATP-binding protein [Rhodospirillales bacterium]